MQRVDARACYWLVAGGCVTVAGNFAAGWCRLKRVNTEVLAAGDGLLGEAAVSALAEACWLIPRGRAGL